MNGMNDRYTVTLPSRVTAGDPLEVVIPTRRFLSCPPGWTLDKERSDATATVLTRRAFGDEAATTLIF